MAAKKTISTRLQFNTFPRVKSLQCDARECRRKAVQLLKEAYLMDEDAMIVASHQRGISWRQVREAYDVSRAISLDFASKIYATLPRELRDMIYKQCFPERVKVELVYYQHEVRDMMGRPNYLFANWVGENVAKEALEAFYKNVMFEFDSRSEPEISLWGSLHSDAFGFGIFPIRYLRHVCLSVKDDQEMAKFPDYAMDNDAYEGSSSTLKRRLSGGRPLSFNDRMRLFPVECDNTRRRLHLLTMMDFKATLRLEVGPSSEPPELRHLLHMSSNSVNEVGTLLS
ncbi:uncharacterized protein BDZ99DRAFT_260278 [Mytilinidion resinicola]|uniref:Uncharacterized protein n=1 Tax=Mytilinidion resinicola TaxID=574789 RepID=A0A6A6YUJ1_9PEZI|nr:uncharacterized protein BDZ99DRAFT_260278 [Mytilinidion resinicola]KAF2812053.1 hypothetical protein BDZ99DRAFT_260278 [Mytilinidion resinicola]